MSARLILSVLAAAFLLFAIRRMTLNGGQVDPAARTWLMVAAIFGAVSLWLWTG